MTFRFINLFTCILAFTFPGRVLLADKTECPTVDAVAHHSSSSTAVATETGSSCTIAIDGANADSMGVPEEASRCSATFFRSEGLGIDLATGNISEEAFAMAMFFLVAPEVDSSASSVDPSNPGF